MPQGLPGGRLERPRNAVGNVVGVFDGLPHGFGIIDDAPDTPDALRQIAGQAPRSIIADEAAMERARSVGVGYRPPLSLCFLHSPDQPILLHEPVAETAR